MHSDIVRRAYGSAGLVASETQIGHVQRSADLPMLVVMLVHDPRSIPSPECAPTQSARPTGRPDQVECPLRMRVACCVSRHRDLSNGYLQTADFGHYVKRNQEVAEKRGALLPFRESLLPGFRCLPRFHRRKRRRRSQDALRSFR